MHLGEYDEARKVIAGALKIRRKYIDLSGQHFYKTTAMMLDEELPPSSSFCVPGDSEKKLVYNTAGDIVTSKSVVVSCSCHCKTVCIQITTPQHIRIHIIF